MDRYEICSHRPATQKHDDRRWVPLPEIHYEDVIKWIIGEITNLVNGVEGKSQVPTSCKVDAFLLALQIILLKHIA